MPGRGLGAPPRPARRRSCTRARACHAGAVLFECVVNVSEGRDETPWPAGRRPPGPPSRHRTGPDHHRAVFTLAGPAERWPASRALASPPGRARPPPPRRRPPPARRPRRRALRPLRAGPPAPRGPHDRRRAARRLRPLAGRGAGGVELPLRTPSRRRDPALAGRPPPGLRPPPEDWPPTRPGPGPPHAPAPPPSAPAGSWWPTTSGSPRPRWPARSRPWSGPPRCGRWPWPWAAGPGLVQPGRSRRLRARTALRPGGEPGGGAGGARRRRRAGGLVPQRSWPRCPPSRRRNWACRRRRRWSARLAGELVLLPRGDPSSGGAATSRRARARARRRRRRSRSLIPPQMPNFSPLARAYSRQSSRTTQPSADLFGLAGRRAALREEQVRVDSHAVRLQLPASFLATVERGDYVHRHLVRPPSSPWVASV